MTITSCCASLTEPPGSWRDPTGSYRLQNLPITTWTVKATRMARPHNSAVRISLRVLTSAAATAATATTADHPPDNLAEHRSRDGGNDDHRPQRAVHLDEPPLHGNLAAVLDDETSARPRARADQRDDRPLPSRRLDAATARAGVTGGSGVEGDPVRGGQIFIHVSPPSLRPGRGDARPVAVVQLCA